MITPNQCVWDEDSFLGQSSLLRAPYSANFASFTHVVDERSLSTPRTVNNEHSCLLPGARACEYVVRSSVSATSGSCGC